jgi:hypothetical protein
MTIKIELKFQLNFELCTRRNEIVNYVHMHIYLCRLLYFYYYVTHRNVSRFTSANLPLPSLNNLRLHIKL